MLCPHFGCDSDDCRWHRPHRFRGKFYCICSKIRDWTISVDDFNGLQGTMTAHPISFTDTHFVFTEKWFLFDVILLFTHQTCATSFASTRSREIHYFELCSRRKAYFPDKILSLSWVMVWLHCQVLRIRKAPNDICHRRTNWWRMRARSSVKWVWQFENARILNLVYWQIWLAVFQHRHRSCMVCLCIRQTTFFYCKIRRHTWVDCVERKKNELCLLNFDN